MKNWSAIEKALAGLAVLVFVVVAGLGVMAWRADDSELLPEGCEGAAIDDDLEADTSPADALRTFVQSRTDFPIDDSWILESNDEGAYVFVSENGGHFEVEVRKGLVRRFMKCPE